MALDAADLKVMFGLSPADAVRFVEDKGYKITWNWWEQRDAAHAKALTVAKVTRMDILQDFASALAGNVEKGQTEADFIKRMTPILQAKGWWGKQIIVDTQGEAEVAQLGSPARLSTIYRTNTQSAYMAGRYTSMWASRASHPWWQYVAILDNRTRQSHRIMNGRVFAAEDPVWDFIYPPNGYNCRCRVRPLTQADVDAEGASTMSSRGRMVTFEADAGVDKRTGEITRITRQGIKVPGKDGKDEIFAPDIGFGGNAGKDWTRPFTPSPVDTLPQTFLRNQPLPPMPRPQVLELPRLPLGLTEEEYFRRFQAAFPATVTQTGVFVDVTREPLPISEALFRDKTGAWKMLKGGRQLDLPMLAEVIQRPDEIWMAWQQVKTGASVLRRRYLKVFEAANGVARGVAVFEEGKDDWMGITLFTVDDAFVRAHGFESAADYIEAQRGGFLAYRRPG
ncbi:MAG: phage minor head protein [Rhodocyclaceae bacterium]|nr:phage minor head protein [Rhodocyclaceae bacterium]